MNTRMNAGCLSTGGLRHWKNRCSDVRCVVASDGPRTYSTASTDSTDSLVGNQLKPWGDGAPIDRRLKP